MDSLGGYCDDFYHSQPHFDQSTSTFKNGSETEQRQTPTPHYQLIPTVDHQLTTTTDELQRLSAILKNTTTKSSYWKKTLEHVQRLLDHLNGTSKDRKLLESSQVYDTGGGFHELRLYLHLPNNKADQLVKDGQTFIIKTKTTYTFCLELSNPFLEDYSVAIGMSCLSSFEFEVLLNELRFSPDSCCHQFSANPFKLQFVPLKNVKEACNDSRRLCTFYFSLQGRELFQLSFKVYSSSGYKKKQRRL
eukprot:TRINITY_DN167_c0_g1_i1.p1 TRINITY_DN167_c0_g1~~TRINITY_DN167_c0_g1_i1.p1  ORF type:complete len:247 (+),score=36.39 TRINITY_DN167_c0_g1_i1:121-861(+)